ncbi:MAG TPA: OsmC family protein [Chitinophagaceae bacterium]|nr:OsmC family protein [Chitinophagaceae bacterium]
MQITATIRNSRQQNELEVSTNEHAKTLSIPGKPDGKGSSVNGGELLFLALATCCCNDIYREAAKRGMSIELVAVTVSGAFGGEGEPASGITYSTKVTAPGETPEAVHDLVQYVERIAEIHNTLRGGVPVTLSAVHC